MDETQQDYAPAEPTPYESTWQDNFDINGTGGFLAEPEVAWHQQGPLVDPNFWIQNKSFIDQVMIDPATGMMQMQDGSPLTPEMEQSIHQAFPEISQGSAGNESMQALADDQEAINIAARDAGLNPEQVNKDFIDSVSRQANPEPGVLDKLGKALMDPSVLAKLLVTGGAAAVSLLVTKLMSNPATAPSAAKIKAQMESLQSAQTAQGQASIREAMGAGGAADQTAGMKAGLAGQRTYEENLAKALKEQGGPEQGIRNQSLAQIARVMAGQYSNPLLDMQSQEAQTTLENESAQKGGNLDWLKESTSGQRAQMFKNLGDQIAREQDRRATLASLKDFPSNFGTTMTPALATATQAPFQNPAAGLPGAQTTAQQQAGYLQAAQLKQYEAQNAADRDLAKGVGDVAAKAGGAIVSGI